MITITSAPPYLTVQDTGWSGRRNIGLPASGAMDGWALRVANVLVGNAVDAAALEWALGRGTVRFHRPTLFAIGGALAEVTLNGVPIAPFVAVQATANDVLTVGRIVQGRFVYIALRGGVAVEPLLGSRSTYLPGRLGGLDGRRLRTGDVLPIGDSPPVHQYVPFQPPRELLPRYDATALRIVRGPQSHLFTERAWATLLETEFRVSAASDRMGFRLDGATLIHSAAAALPSEGACAGAVQVPNDAPPIVLMPDGPTVGGYPKIGVVASADLPVLAQRTPGDTVRFSVVTVDEAQRLYRRRAVQLHTLEQLVRATNPFDRATT